MKCHVVLFVTCFSLLLPTLATAHHSPFLYFNPAQTVELEGEISNLRWRNPHVMITLETNEGSTYEVEANSLSILQRMGIDREVFASGTKVKVAGWPSVRGVNEIFVTNLLQANGTEVIMFPGSPAVWADETEGDSTRWLVTEDSLGENNSDAEGIFHVWATSLANPGEVLIFDRYNFDLTEQAEKARAEYDIFSNVTLNSCEDKGMPFLMEQPYPMQFAKGENAILMHMEEGDMLRVFDMSADADYSDREPIPLGYSTGRWEGETLVVTTVNSSWTTIDVTGVPSAPETIFVEQFIPSESGQRLDYRLTITDPNLFNSPQTFTKYWLWVPGEKIEPFNCVTD